MFEEKSEKIEKKNAEPQLLFQTFRENKKYFGMAGVLNSRQQMTGGANPRGNGFELEFKGNLK